ncbi:hypothetical protein ALI22I_14465 [Saccharothrix sp. ALI-22-I]|uniref:DUF4386 domain-containing protein n=1 Tax=Saccharothrix sp. ALI-22-I TaxID=1933778 RepID=UPI00097BC639|nr:DUF4386 domain-containing protein [Saccharothrix sp. ALI-22-I]ONI89806.1 hypothetical protein ALI22I_14465 [Saccharothrix sp. ALI-22-I]
MNSPKRAARVAGALYLLLAVLNGVAEMYVRATIVERGDAAATADNVVAHATLFRLGFVADLVGIACLLFVAMALHQLLRHVSKNAAAAMVVFSAVAVALMCANLLNHFAALMIATDASFATSFGPDGSDALVLMFLDLHRNGYLIAQVFFGLWLLPLGYLVRDSGWFPRSLGVLLVVGCFGYLADLVAKFLLPDLAPTLSPFVLVPAVVAELWLIACLLRNSVKKDALPSGLAPAAA